MDLRNLETTTTMAIEAVYKEYWNLIPERYKLLEKSQRNNCGTYNFEEYGLEENNTKPKVPKSKPLTYKKVEEIENKFLDPETMNDYGWYCEQLKDRDQYFDLQPFYDPLLDFENRLHYKLVGVNYPDRKDPWFIITWNCGNGILKSSLTNRRFDTKTIITPGGQKAKFDFIDTELDVTLCFNSNSMQALFELQENIRIGRREKFVIDSRIHSVIGRFPVTVSIIDTGNIAKASRDKSTLCNLTVTYRIDYPIIGNVQLDNGDVIKVIRANEYTMPTDYMDTNLIGKDVILPDNDKIIQELLDKGSITEEDLKY
jgi:hypothetical protein